MVTLTMPFFTIFTLLLIIISSINGEENTMNALKKSILKTNRTDTNFSFSGEFCFWSGIQCDNQSRVLSINWSSQSLSGYFPPSLSNLTYLRFLSLNNNTFYGSFPSLSSLTSLVAVDFSDNKFNNISPDTFSGLTSLNYLYLSNNPNLSSWGFPYEIIGSINLITFSASNANISGYIPEFLGSFKSLQILDISRNIMIGTIPTVLTDLPDLVRIDVSHNKLGGEIPLFHGEVIVHTFGNNFDEHVNHHYRKKSNRDNLVLWIVLFTVAAITLLGIAVLIYLIGSKWWKKRISESDNLKAADVLEMSTGPPKKFDYESLRKATNNFNDQNLLGKGGFGKVFRGTLSNGVLVAVKQIFHCGSVSEKSFQSEVRALSWARHHPNLVKLYGYNKEFKKDPMLVYEYMSNRSLDKWIFESNSRLGNLEWATKIRIMLDTAKGLSCLHEVSSNRTTILHRDIKPSNVVLDENFTAKLCDFGLAKFFSKDKTSTRTRAGGTWGYKAPELFSSWKRTEKSDVYSYGVVLIETVFERKNLDDRNRETTLVGLIKSRVVAEPLSNLIDLIDNSGRCSDMLGKPQEMEFIVGLALSCVDDDPATRPSMLKVIQELESLIEPTRIPSSEYLLEDASEPTSEDS